MSTKEEKLRKNSSQAMTKALKNKIGNPTWRDIDELEKEVRKVKSSNIKLMAQEITVGQLSYGLDGTIRFRDKPIKMRYQLKSLCVLFMSKNKELVDYSTIQEEIISTHKRSKINFKTITKYASELQVLLRKCIKKKVIFNQGKEGYIFDID